MKKASEIKAEALASLEGKDMRKTTLLFWVLIFGVAIVMMIAMAILILIPFLGILAAIVIYFALLFMIMTLIYKYNAACLDISHGKSRTLKDILDFSGNDSLLRSFLGLFIPGMVVFIMGCVTMVPFYFIFTKLIMPAIPPALLILVGFIFSVILLIPAFIYYYACSLSPFLAHDYPQKGIVECVKKSIATMKGNKLRLMWLDLTFIGWYLLIFLAGLILSYVARYGIFAMLLGMAIYIVIYIAIMCHVFPYWTTARAHFYNHLMDNKNIVQDILDDPEDPDEEDLDRILNNK